MEHNINVQDRKGNTPLILACKNNHGHIAAILNYNPDVNIRNIKNKDAYSYLLKNMKGKNIIKLTQQFIKLGLDINFQDSDKWTPLIKIIMDRNNHTEDLIKIFIKAGADLNPAFFYAVEYSSDKIVKMFIEAGADINMTNGEGITPLMLTRSNILTNKLFIGADLDAQDCKGWTALMHNVVINVKNTLNIIKYLLKSGANINIQNKSGNTATMLALMRYPNICSLKCIKLLLEYKPDLDIKNNKGKSAAQLFTQLHL
jgi:ankyrin repeat protein